MVTLCIECKNVLTSAKKPFCATAVITGSTGGEEVVYPEACIETLSSLGRHSLEMQTLFHLARLNLFVYK